MIDPYRIPPTASISSFRRTPFERRVRRARVGAIRFWRDYLASPAVGLGTLLLGSWFMLQVIAGFVASLGGLGFLACALEYALFDKPLSSSLFGYFKLGSAFLAISVLLVATMTWAYIQLSLFGARVRNGLKDKE